MKKYKTVRGKQYAIHSPTDGNVQTLSGEIITSFYGSNQNYFISPVNEINIPDDAVCVPMFPLIAEKFIHKFGNKYNLPSGYIPVYFLESAAKQYIDTLFSPTEKTEILFQAQSDRTSYLFANCNANHDEGNDKRIWMTTTSSSGFGASFIAFGTYSITTQKFDGVYPYAKNIYGIKNGTVTYGGKERTIGVVEPFSGGPTLTIFRHRRDVSSYVIRYWWCKLWEDNKPVRVYIPCIAPNGTACMYDKITQTPYYNVNTASTGDFRVGLTVEQARQLYKLPTVTNKTLYISLPSSVFDEEGNITDAEINNALETARTNNWNFEIQNYTE